MKPSTENSANLTEKQMIVSSVHCECALALYLLKKYWYINGQKKRYLKIQLGVSKSGCLMCRRFIDILMVENPGVAIIVTSFNDKIPVGWKVPNASSTLVKNTIHKQVSNLVDNVFERVLSTCRELKQNDVVSTSVISGRHSGW
jgi:hypothetical protein